MKVVLQLDSRSSIHLSSSDPIAQLNQVVDLHYGQRTKCISQEEKVDRANASAS